MLVKFHSKAHGDITMFGDVAIKLLKMMGHSGTVPSAIMPEDISAALVRLEEALSHEPADPAAADTANAVADDEAPRIGMRQRAFPLIQMLRAAAQSDTAVMWDH